MRKPIIQANESLVRNGNFTQSLNEWKRGPINPSWLGTPSEFYLGEMIRILSAGNQSSVSQEILIPKNTDANARYVLSFLCETRHTEAGLMRITGGGLENPVEIALEPGEERNHEDDQARLASGQPLELKPKRYEVATDLNFKSQETMTITIVSPKNEISDDYSKICVTRIKLEVHLGKAVMQSLILDEESVPSTGTLYMCLGASDRVPHQLGFVLAPDNAWEGTKASLTIDDNPQGAIVAEPGWDVDHPLEERWSLECPLIGDQDPYLFAMSLRNQYTAEPYPIEVSLGHHRLVFRDVLEAAYYPILEHKQKVRLGVQVASFYTGQVLSGRTVTWSVAGPQAKGTDVTDEQGWAYFEYEPIAEGNYDVVASVESLYYAAGVVTQTLAVRVLAIDPWTDVLAVVDGVAARWEEKNGYPNRGAEYHLNVKLPADLLGTDLTLHSSGDSLEQLGVVVNPALEKPVPAMDVNLRWILTSADHHDGRFDLSLVCSKLLLPSPKKRMSLARNLVKVGKVQEANKFPVLDENESVLLRVQVVHLVVSGDGDPVINALVEWETPEGKVQTRSGAGGWASVLYTPQRAGDLIVTASIKAHEEAVAVDQPFNVKVIATSPWKSEVRILLDEKEVDRNTLGVLCRRGLTHTLKVEPVSGSTWVGKNISLHWRGGAPDIGLVLGELGMPKPLLADGVEWEFSSQVETSISSLFELELRLESISIVRELSGRLMSADLTEEMSLMLDQVAAALDNQTLYPCLGALHRFNVLPNALSPLVGLEVSLTWSGTPADQLGATVQPTLDLQQVLSDSGAIWTLDFTASQQPGQFALALALPQLAFVAIAKPMALAHNKIRIGTWRESPVDPIVGQDSAWSWVRAFSYFTGRAVDQVPVKWLTTEGFSEVATDAEGWSGFGFAPVVDGPHEVTALVVSPYDAYEEKRPMKVTGLAKDPWGELMVKFDGGTARRWGAKTYFPRRKGEHTLELLAPRKSPLLGRYLTLGMTGTGPAELGVRFLPEALGVPRKFHKLLGLQYTFKADDLKDGSFALRLSSERLASLSPENAMSLGESSQVLKISGNSSAFQVLDWGQKFVGKVTVVSVISGRPMVGWQVKWSHPDFGVETSVTDYYGVAKFSFTPTTPGASELVATVGDGLNSDSLSISFALNEPRKLSEFFVTEPTTQFDAFAQVKVVSSRNGMPLKNVEVMWTYVNEALPSTFTDDHGIARLSFGVSMDADGRGLLSATVKGGEFGWETACLMYTGLVPIIHELTSSELTISLGEEASAEIRVVSRQDGLPREGIQVRWEYPGLSLPATVTGRDGKSQITFKPVERGAQRLTALVGLNDRKSLGFNIISAVAITELKLPRLMIYLGTTFNVLALVQGGNRSVLWSYPGVEDRTTVVNQGWTRSGEIMPTELPVNGLATVTAKVVGSETPASTMSQTIWVTSLESPMVKNSLLYLGTKTEPESNTSAVIVSLNKEVVLRLVVAGELQGRQFSIFCSRSDIHFDPPTGVPVDGETQYTWRMLVNVRYLGPFVVTIASPGLDGSRGIDCKVFEIGNEEGDVLADSGRG